VAKSNYSKSLFEAKTNIAHEFFSDSNPRARRRLIEILEGALHCYATIGFDKTTYQEIANACGVTQPLVIHYFKKKTDIFELVARYIRLNFQNMAIEAISKETTAEKMMIAYNDSCFEWSQKFSQHAKVWALYYYHCGLKPKYKKLNTEMVTLGEARILAILEAGVKAKEFQPGALSVRARMIRLVVTGMLILDNTEKLPVSRNDFISECREEILKIAKNI